MPRPPPAQARTFVERQIPAGKAHADLAATLGAFLGSRTGSGEGGKAALGVGATGLFAKEVEVKRLLRPAPQVFNKRSQRASTRRHDDRDHDALVIRAP